MVTYDLYFRMLYNDMAKRMQKYLEIKKITDSNERENEEKKFVEEELEVIGNYLKREKEIRRRLKEGLRKQYKDIKYKPERGSFRRIKRHNLGKFNKIIRLGKRTYSYLKKYEKNIGNPIIEQSLFNEIYAEFRDIEALISDVKTRKYIDGIRIFAWKNKKPIIALMALLLVTSLSITLLTKQHFELVRTQTTEVGFVKDNITDQDWAQGAHKSYGAHTMLSRIVGHRAPLPGVEYDTYKRGLERIVIFKKGVSHILPKSILNMVGEDSQVTINALNRGEFMVGIKTKEGEILVVQFHQDKLVKEHINKLGIGEKEIEELYLHLLSKVEHLVNHN